MDKKEKERRKEEKEYVHLLLFEDYGASVLYHRFFFQTTNT